MKVYVYLSVHANDEAIEGRKTAQIFGSLVEDQVFGRDRFLSLSLSVSTDGCLSVSQFVYLSELSLSLSDCLSVALVS